ncbi:hypothetical protein CI102_4561 [Trichoderma harzianum]|nr:hypothetical protein CI102_4561 [Trichoderma harzianum]
MGCGGGTFFSTPSACRPLPNGMGRTGRAARPVSRLAQDHYRSKGCLEVPNTPGVDSGRQMQIRCCAAAIRAPAGGPTPSTTSALPCPTPGRQKHAPLRIDGQTQLSQPSLCPKPCFGLIGMPRLGCALYYSVPFLVRCNQAQHSFISGLCLSFALSQPVSLSCRQPSCSDPIAGLVRLSGFNSKVVRAGTDYTSISLFTANWIRLIG